MKLGCVVMAAGRGQRFGANKLLAPLCGKPLLAYALQALPMERFAAVCAVVSRSDTAQLCEQMGVPTVLYPGGPQSETVRRGITAMEGMDGCMFLVGDQPLCTTASIRRLLNDFAAAPNAVHRLSFADCPGSPVVFPRRLFGALAALEGEQGGMAAAKGEAVRCTQAQFAEELWDADTPAALVRLERILLENQEKFERKELNP